MPLRDPIRFTEFFEWLKENECSLRRFSKDSGIDKMCLWRAVHGQTQTINLDLIGKISNATGGKIGLAEFAAFYDRLAQTRQVTK